jgi:hypothetical protein
MAEYTTAEINRSFLYYQRRKAFGDALKKYRQ